MEQDKKMVRRLWGGTRGAALVTVLLLSAGVWTKQSRAENYSFDAKRTEVHISYQMGFLSQSARFQEVAGTVDADEGTSMLRHVDAVIKTAGLSAPEPVSENELKGSSFLDVANYPEIRFRSQSGRGATKDGSVLSGELTMRGVTRPITLQVHFYGAGVPLPPESGHARSITEGPFLTATAKISRSSFNMTAYQFLVSDEIDIQISAPLQKKHTTATK
jgi:polyisoprenoid-binding protein YceI